MAALLLSSHTKAMSKIAIKTMRIAKIAIKQISSRERSEGKWYVVKKKEAFFTRKIVALLLAYRYAGDNPDSVLSSRFVNAKRETTGSA